jgi:hypothetical protein
MSRDELLAALERLGDLLPKEAQVVIAGGAALILGGYVERATADADVVHSEPRLAQLRSAILQVAEEKGLSKDVDFEDLAEICPTDQEIALSSASSSGSRASGRTRH